MLSDHFIEGVYQSGDLQCCFVNTFQKPESEKHICYYTAPGETPDKIKLYEVIQQIYKHPDAPENAVIPIITVEHLGTFRRDSNGELVLLEAIQKTTKKLHWCSS